MLKATLLKVTLIDYPGKVACGVFVHGCNFRCPFCHNPELVIGKPESLYTKAEIFEYLKLRKNMLDGVVFSGGECLLDSEIIAWIKEAKSLGYDIKIDTNGSFPEKIAELIKLGIVDYWAMDIKSDKDTYFNVAGLEHNSAQHRSNSKTSDSLVETRLTNILKSIDLIMKSGVDYEFRTTFVPGLHTPASAKGIGELIKGAKRFYIQNFRAGNVLDSAYASKNGFTDAQLEEFRSIISKYVSDVYIRS
jgi:pyruvate formate lyase activating enzyme